MFFDRAVNAKGVGIGEILISPTGQHYLATTWLHFFCTNNSAEYEACIMGMNMAVDLDVEELLIMGDSDLIIRQAQAEIEDNEWVKTRLEQLTMIDEKWMAAVCHGQLYQQRKAHVYNKKVWPRNFEVEKLVLRCILPHHKEAKGKFAPNWKGSYIIRKLLPKRALYMGDIEGNYPETVVNADAVKRYYV
uniref:Uncharacterized protein LOC104240316 n=1 Tax=Nicotiana sylvestris TaxID=4096 RepID=A0A1U7XN27_NICSY|nr:PREDICTED: uncharacterized protein LOC104240316 [Nicotiana sylvestris]